MHVRNSKTQAAQFRAIQADFEKLSGYGRDWISNDMAGIDRDVIALRELARRIEEFAQWVQHDLQSA